MFGSLPLQKTSFRSRCVTNSTKIDDWQYNNWYWYVPCSSKMSAIRVDLSNARPPFLHPEHLHQHTLKVKLLYDMQLILLSSYPSKWIWQTPVAPVHVRLYEIAHTPRLSP